MPFFTRKSSAASISSSSPVSLKDKIKANRRARAAATVAAAAQISQPLSSKKDFEAAFVDLSSRIGGPGGSAVPSVSDVQSPSSSAPPPSYDDFSDCVPPPAYHKRKVVVRGQHATQDFNLLHAQFAAGVVRQPNTAGL